MEVLYVILALLGLVAAFFIIRFLLGLAVDAIACIICMFLYFLPAIFILPPAVYSLATASYNVGAILLVILFVIMFLWTKYRVMNRILLVRTCPKCKTFSGAITKQGYHLKEVTFNKKNELEYFNDDGERVGHIDLGYTEDSFFRHDKYFSMKCTKCNSTWEQNKTLYDVLSSVSQDIYHWWI